MCVMFPSTLPAISITSAIMIRFVPLSLSVSDYDVNKKRRKHFWCILPSLFYIMCLGVASYLSDLPYRYLPLLLKWEFVIFIMKVLTQFSNKKTELILKTEILSIIRKLIIVFIIQLHLNTVQI